MVDSREQKANIFVGKQIKKWRGKTSQAKLSASIGVPRSVLTEIEAGNVRCSVGRLCLVAETLNRPISDFLPERYQALENQRKTDP